MFRSHRFAIAVFSAALMAATPIEAAPIGPSAYSQMSWRMIGPFRGGRTVAVTGVPDQPNLFYMAPVNGGVWKSDDYGRVWTPIFDGQTSGSIGAIAIAPSDPQIIYVGSGEGLRRPDLATGDGIYKSLDGGRTWAHLGLRDGQQINGLAVDPRDPNRVYAAVMGHPYGPNSQRGLYRSLDGGTTWKAVLSKNDSDTGAVTVTIDPNHPDTLYAALWASRNAPWHLTQVYELPNNDGLFKSTDGGTTWAHLNGGLPRNVGRIGVSVSPADSNRVYAWVNTGDTCGVYRSGDAGTTWAKTNSEERVCGRGEDFSGITADPKNADVVYAANTSTYRSIDGGKNWTAIKGAPGGDDYHTIWINPNNPRIILLGCDQGATLSVNGGATWSSWYNQPTAQFYHVITDNRFPYWVYGAQQESGSAGVASRGNDGAITSSDWHPVAAEEYGYIAPDPLHPNIIFGGKLSRFDFVTGQAQDVMPAEVRGSTYRFSRTAPLIFSHRDPRTLYFGSDVLFKTRDSGHSWQVISPDLTRAHPGMPSSMGNFAATDPEKGNERGVIYSLAPSYLR
ncbi:MAG: glycoside hydrolase, partial [Candidatus Baltobacteraceae bacterium]